MWNKPWLPILLALLTLAIAAQLSVDLKMAEENIPITGQTLAVILVAYFLPKYWGAWAVFIYLILAALGLPILADGSGGIEKFWGGSAGFLFGFLLAATLISWLTFAQKSQSIWQVLFLNILGTIVILALGNAWLIFKYGWSNGLEYGFFPFWKGAIIKIILGVFIIHVVQNFRQKKMAQ